MTAAWLFTYSLWLVYLPLYKIAKCAQTTYAGWVIVSIGLSQWGGTMVWHTLHWFREESVGFYFLIIHLGALLIILAMLTTATKNKTKQIKNKTCRPCSKSRVNSQTSCSSKTMEHNSSRFQHSLSSGPFCTFD